MSFRKLCIDADRALRRMPPPDLPDRWDSMSVGSLWQAVNDPRRYGTPKVTINAILHAVRSRGIAALKEPATAERLARCDDAAKVEIRRRMSRLLEIA
jgi:hypothetical protein